MTMQTRLKQLIATITKDVKRLLSSQFNAGLLLIGPLLLIGLVGFAFQGNSLNDVTVGIVGNTDGLHKLRTRHQRRGIHGELLQRRGTLLS
jgi:hypothetical protein